MTEIKRKIYLAEGDAPNGYQSTPIGFLPSDWEYAKLSDLSLELTETAGEKKYETVSISAGIGFVNQAKKFGKELSGKQYEKYIVLRKGDFSYNKGNSNRYPQGCIYRLNDREEAAVPNVFESFRIVKGCPEYYEQLFISGFLNHQLFRLINHGVRDDGLLNLTGTDFYSCLLPVPPVKEQERIADLLSTCDSMISRYEEIAEQYRSLKKHLLNNMFPKGGSAVPEIRFPGFTDAWEQCKLGDMMNVTSVKRIHQSDWTESGIRFLRARDIVAAAKGEEPSDLLYISKEKYEEYSALSGKVAIDDLLVTGVGTIGIPYLISNSEPIYFKDGNIIWFQNCGKINGKFFYYSFTGEQIQSFIKDSAGIGTVGTYTIESGKKTPILLPGIEEQRKLGAFFTDLDNLITLHQRNLIIILCVSISKWF